MAQGDSGNDTGPGGWNGPLNNTPVSSSNNTNNTNTNTNTPTPSTGTTDTNAATSIVPDKPNAAGEMNVVDYASQVALDPSKAMQQDNPNTPQNESTYLQDHVQNIDANAEGTNITAPTQGATQEGQTTEAQAQTQGAVDPREATTYDAATSQQNVEQNGQATAQQGQINENDLVTAPQEDVEAMANGQGPIGQALNDYASQDLNTVDSKATVKGQLEALQADFQDANGNPVIPAWAAATARNVSKIAAFKGMSGTAATAAMAQAIMEASIPVAQQDASFFQTLTLKNLDNKQQATINKANVLANFEMANLDNRMTAAVENSKAFLQMDMANLDNKQQAEMLNTQSRVQSILEDSKQENAARLFNAQSQQDMDKFYDNLNASIQQFNTSQLNSMSQFNAGQSNDMSKFNADLENNRDQFYKTMQYNVDTANAKWRQTVTLQDNANQFEAAATDVKTMTTISQEQLNQIWDRSDALLDYAWKSAENEADRNAQMAIAKFQAKSASKLADQQGLGAIAGSIAGKAAGSLLDWAFG